MSREDVELAREYVKVFDAGGLDATAPLRHPDIELHDPPELPDADRYRGEAAGAARVASLLAMGWDGKYNVQEYIDAGDEVILVCAMQGRVALGDAPFELTLVQVLRFEDGKVTRIRQFFSKEAALAATPGAQAAEAASP